MYRSAVLFAGTLLASGTPAFAATTMSGEATAGAQPAGTASTVDAQEAQPGGQEIIVTAQKRSQRLQDVPASVSVVSTRDLTKEGVVKFADYATRVPGMAVSAVRGGQAQVTLRGITTGASQPGSATGYYIDEAPVGSVNAFTGGSATTPDLDPSDLARIEVLKGPQGTLYGSNALGGLLRFITADPDFNAVHVNASAGISQVSHGDTGYALRGMVNVPVIGDSVVAHVSGFTRRDPGYIDNVEPRTGGKDVNSNRISGGRALVAAKITSDVRLDLSAIMQDTRANASNVEDVDAATLEPLYGHLKQRRYADESARVKFYLYNATLRANVGKINLLSSTTFQHTSWAGFNDATQSFGVAIGGLLGLPPGMLGIQGEQDTYTKRWSQELRATANGLAGGLLDLQGGFYWTKETDTNEIPSYDPFLTATGAPVELPSIVTAFIDSTYKEYSLFGNVDLHLTAKFDVLGGLRYAHDKQGYAQNYSGLIIPGGTFDKTGSEEKGVVTYLLSPRYRFSRNLMVYGRVASGYRPGGPNAAPSFIPAESTFGPDKLTQYEVGVKASTPDNRLSLDLAAFHTDWKQIQIQTSTAGFNYIVNGGTAKSDGVEATLRYAPIQNLNFGANVGYTNARLASDAPAAGGLEGDRLPYVPRWAGSITADYKTPVSGDWNAVLGGSINYTGKEVSDYSQRFPKPVDAYTTINVRAGLESSRWSLSLYAKNLTDRRGVLIYTMQGLAPSSTPGAPYSAAVITPRTIGVEAALRF